MFIKFRFSIYFVFMPTILQHTNTVIFKSRVRNQRVPIIEETKKRRNELNPTANIIAWPTR